MPELVLAAPKAPVPLIHLALNRAARTFLKATRAWQEWLEPTDVTGEAFAEYTFELPQGAELLRLERATLDGRPLEVAQSRDLPADPWQHELRGRAYLVTTNLREFTVRTSSAGRLQVYASLMPSLRGNSVPDEVASLYHEAIREGAKAELLATEGTDYYKPDQAGVALAFFQSAMDDATADVWRSNTSRGSRGRASWL
ncbi:MULTISPECIES: hypothetical protein [Delftia]|uniref:Uncharacterized protein n=1 Tax=Delftia acidovorans TaxID=80866 RepID=A0AAJ2R2A3_DELAC|nr:MULTISPECIES: hypothetical protein [Delftia]MDX4954018.1 hypothetical protein [Delftia acidovorans]